MPHTIRFVLDLSGGGGGVGRVGVHFGLILTKKKETGVWE